MEKIILPTALHYHVVWLKDIVYCKSNNSSTIFYLNNGQEITVSISIKEFEQRLCAHNFFRTHQSYLVNINFVCLIDKSDNFNLTLHNGSKIPVSMRKRKELMKMFIEE